ncbi:MAG: MDR family oxidoreductase [Propionibacteriaceae bacterium]|nr:MDR family oxidoreductase [Propionibacteriaceae bacterium]
MVQAIVVREVPSDGKPSRVAALEDVSESFLGDGDTVVDVAYSGINYKDALALTGRPGVVRQTPLVAGIDLVGTVVTSGDERFAAGDWIILNGAGSSENRHGGLATRAHIDPALAIPLPHGMTPARAAALGTAGYTAALAVARLLREDVSPEDGPVLVTGATGGVGSIATLLLSRAGFEVAALTGRADELGGYIRSLGASTLVDRSELNSYGKPLQSARWAGVVDAVGGAVLANALAQTKPGGVVAACGLAGSADLPTTVMPFILRGVTLAGIDSVWAEPAARTEAWHLLARDLDGDVLDSLTETVSLTGAIAAAERLLDGQAHGRILVEISGG